jgi:hypothetical protein
MEGIWQKGGLSLQYTVNGGTALIDGDYGNAELQWHVGLLESIYPSFNLSLNKCFLN